MRKNIVPLLPVGDRLYAIGRRTPDGWIDGLTRQEYPNVQVFWDRQAAQNSMDYCAPDLRADLRKLVAEGSYEITELAVTETTYQLLFMVPCGGYKSVTIIYSVAPNGKVVGVRHGLRPLLRYYSARYPAEWQVAQERLDRTLQEVIDGMESETASTKQAQPPVEDEPDMFAEPANEERR